MNPDTLILGLIIFNNRPQTSTIQPVFSASKANSHAPPASFAPEFAHDYKIDKLAPFRKRLNGFDQGLIGYLGSVQSELPSILFDLPFSDKKRLVDSAISPESGERFVCVICGQMISLKKGI